MKTLILALAVFAVSGNLNAQNMKIGFRLEPSIFLTGYNNENNVEFSLSSFYLMAGVKLTNQLTVEVRPGFVRAKDYFGTEVGLFLKGEIISKGVFFVAGICNHWNGGGGGGITKSSHEKQILYKGIGFGFDADSMFSFDLMYYWSSDNNYATINTPGYYGWTSSQKTMNGIIKIGLCISGDL